MILYSTGCPKCQVLIKKLDNACISYEICSDPKIMQEKNLLAVPALEINGTIYNFKEAVNLINRGELL